MDTEERYVDVTITRITYQTHIFRVKLSTSSYKPDVIELALQEAYNASWDNFSSGNVEYELESISDVIAEGAD